MNEFDLFLFWRRVLMIACTVYATVRMIQAGWEWYRHLRSPGRGVAIARQYLLVQLLRISGRRFAWSLAEILILTGVFLAVVFAHRFM